VLIKLGRLLFVGLLALTLAPSVASAAEQRMRDMSHSVQNPEDATEVWPTHYVSRIAMGGDFKKQVCLGLTNRKAPALVAKGCATRNPGRYVVTPVTEKHLLQKWIRYRGAIRPALAVDYCLTVKNVRGKDLKPGTPVVLQKCTLKRDGSPKTANQYWHRQGYHREPDIGLHLKVRNTNLCLALAGGKTPLLRKCSEYDDQQYRAGDEIFSVVAPYHHFRSMRVLPARARIAVSGNSKLCLDTNGGAVYLKRCSRADLSQYWIGVAGPNIAGHFLYSPKYAKCLDIQGGGGFRNGKKIILYSCKFNARSASTQEVLPRYSGRSL